MFFGAHANVQICWPEKKAGACRVVTLFYFWVAHSIPVHKIKLFPIECQEYKNPPLLQMLCYYDHSLCSSKMKLYLPLLAVSALFAIVMAAVSCECDEDDTGVSEFH